MLPNSLTASIREVGEANGGALLLDAAQGRAILTDAQFAFDLCRNLKRAGFTSFIDFTGVHNGGDNFTLYLTLRAPDHAHARLTLKWKWAQADTYAACEQRDPPAAVARQAAQPRESDSSGNTGGDGTLPDGGQRPPPLGDVIHPSLSTIWPAAAVAEREIFEMLGIPFAGNALEPLLLEEAFVGHPLRREFEPVPQETYIDRLLSQRHAEGLIHALEEQSNVAADSLPGYASEGKPGDATQVSRELGQPISAETVRPPEPPEPSHD